MKSVIVYLMIGVLWTMYLDSVNTKLLDSQLLGDEDKMTWGLRIGSILLWPVSVLGAISAYLNNNNGDMGNGYAS